MRRDSVVRPASGFTLVELLIVVALGVVLIALSAPSVRKMIEMQRLRSVNAQLVTDLQFARSDAASRGEPITISFDWTGSSQMTCYTIHTCGGAAATACSCSCFQGAGARCTAPQVEIRTVQLPVAERVRQQSVRSAPPPVQAIDSLRFDPITGGVEARFIGVGAINLDPQGDAWLETSLTGWSPTPILRTVVSQAGRPSVCSPNGVVSGVPAC